MWGWLSDNATEIGAIAAIASTISIFLAAVLAIPRYYRASKGVLAERSIEMADAILAPEFSKLVNAVIELTADSLKQPSSAIAPKRGCFYQRRSGLEIVLPSKYRTDAVRLLNNLERLAVLVRSNSVDEKTLRRLIRTAVVRDWFFFGKWVEENYRQRQAAENAFVEFEWLARRWAHAEESPLLDRGLRIEFGE